MFTSPSTTGEQSRCSPALLYHTSLQWTSSALTAQRRACPNASQVNCSTLGRTKRRSTASSCPTKAVWWWLPSRPVAGGAADRVRLVIGWALSSSALAWIRFPILVRKVDQDVVSVLRECFCDFVGFFSGRKLLTGKTGLRPIWSNCSQLDLSEWPPLRLLFFLQQWHVSKRCFQQMNVFSVVCVVVSQNKNVACILAFLCFFCGTHLFFVC